MSGPVTKESVLAISRPSGNAGARVPVGRAFISDRLFSNLSGGIPGAAASFPSSIKVEEPNMSVYGTLAHGPCEGLFFFK